ncbi:hypothetical protein [uncultured Pseudodesulfovibrio sp.]|uniref:hypothetical protein n=1 Tax=uncultured Pseudodesulfovibrio sp. TaxID=2035858 RepID=UPI0029C766B6|nr:hypothetical protein [uncultured Pseudodesulfovibrio sp.]
MTLDMYEDTLYGQVLPLDWENDVVTGIILLVDGEEEFIVKPDKVGGRLVDHLDRWITAEGIVEETEDESYIKIRNFKVDDEFDYAGDDNW